jgi:Ca2+-binding RTX toxin-like protein
MRKMATLVGMVALMIMVLAPVAMAVNKQCTNNPCWGTNYRDTLYERGGRGVPDNIIGRRYGDLINANAFTADRDVLEGQRGDDRLKAQDGDGRDFLYGGPGFDICYLDEGDPYVSCEVVDLAIE